MRGGREEGDAAATESPSLSPLVKISSWDDLLVGLAAAVAEGGTDPRPASAGAKTRGGRAQPWRPAHL